VNAYRCHGPGDGYQAVLDRVRADAREQVATVLGIADQRLRDRHLQEQVVHVGVRMARRAHDRDLAGERVRATQPVDLAGVR